MKAWTNFGRMLVLMLCIVTTGAAQNYTRLWDRVKDYEQKDLPKSASAEARAIYEKAKAERNVPQMMKAYLTIMAFRGTVSPDSIAIDKQGLEDWAADPATAVPDRAVLYSILGGMTLSEDFAKGNEFLKRSLADSVALIDYPAERLVPMVKTGETSRLYLDDNLYDLLARRAIELWQQHRWRTEMEEITSTIQGTYQSLLHLYEKRGMASAWLLTALEANPSVSEAQLSEWIEEYGRLEVCAEVYLRLSDAMREEGRQAERLALLQEGIDRYPQYSRINVLKNRVEEILAPQLNVSVRYTYPKRPMALDVDYVNIKGFTAYLYRLDLTADSPLLENVSPQNVMKYGSLVQQQHFELPATVDYQKETEKMEWNAPQAGIYYLVQVPDGYRDIRRGTLLHLTSLYLMHRSLPDDTQELVVVDKQSGHPVSGAEVLAYARQSDGYVVKEHCLANEDGVVKVAGKADGLYFYQARTLTDAAMPIQKLRFAKIRNAVSEKEERYVSLFTDRGLYRPGQLLCFSGIVYGQRKDSLRVKEGTSCLVRLIDADGQEVGAQDVKTDDFGAFSGTFQLPSSGKNGTYRLQTQQGTTTFLVEAYKRPTFEVVFKPVVDAYRVGDTVLVKGQAQSFAGFPIAGAAVKYSVSRRNGYGKYRGTVTHRVTGESVTDRDGGFELPVYLQPMPEDAHWDVYCYDVTVDVTAMSGETQSDILSLPLARSAFQIAVNGWDGEKIVKEERRPLMWDVRNLRHQPVNVEVDWQICKAGPNADEAVVRAGQAVSNVEYIPEEIYALPSGRYRMKATIKDESGQEDRCEVTFDLFSLDDKKVPCKSDIWSYQTSDVFTTDGPVTVLFGSSEKDVHLFYDVFAGNRHIESRRIEFSDSLMTFRFDYKEMYGDGLRVCFAFVKEGRLLTNDISIQKPKPDKRLELRWKTFRDKLQPGSRETWALSVVHPDGTPADARLLATLYDASLDRLAPYQWYLDFYFRRQLPDIFWRSVWPLPLSWRFSFPLKQLKVSPLSYSTLDLPLSLAQSGTRMVMFKANAAVEESLRNDAADVSESSSMETMDETQLRTNFEETAFFYPQLRTNAKGVVSFEFSLPESLTEWKFMGLAHTKEMDYGMITAKAVANKEFMLQPNLPRFVRVGDKIKMAASLVNLSEKDVEGVVRMELLDPETEKVVVSQRRKFRVRPNVTDTVSFAFEVGENREMLVCRMVAESDRFSDGEQRYLPVLGDKLRITESVLLNVNGKGTSVFSLEELFNHHSPTVAFPKMTVEFTGNPIWYAVEALPMLANPETENVLAWAAAYYANSLTAYLRQTVPGIAGLQDGKDLQGLLSEAETHLQELQGPDGSWSWYKGMPGNRSMTTYVTLLLARLRQMTNGGWDGTRVDGMYRKAFDYLVREISEEVNRMKKMEKDGGRKLLPSESVMQYLYVCALENRLQTMTPDDRYLVSCLQENAGALNIYGKALGAIVLHQAGKEAKAKEVMQSLMEYSVVTPRMGRYFDSPKAEYAWFSYRIPTQVAAMEAVNRMTSDKKTVEEMKYWLLGQKQAQDWKTPVATADAVYVLLTTGENWLTDSGGVKIALGKEMLEIPADTVLRYVEQEIPGDVLRIKEAVVEKTSEGLGWGAVYAEFLEDIDKIGMQGNVLKVMRTLYKNGKPLPEGETVQVGDKLTVRVTVSAGMDLDFVQIKDERAACMEPLDAVSGYRWRGNIGYYQETKDASTVFYVDKMKKGKHTLDYDVYVTAEGEFRLGIATVQSVYAPEFGGHSEAGSILVK